MTCEVQQQVGLIMGCRADFKAQENDAWSNRGILWQSRNPVKVLEAAFDRCL